MTVGRDHLHVLPLQHEQDSVEGIARFVVGNRKARLGEQLAERLRVQADPRRGRCRDDRGKIVGRQTNELVGCARAPKTDARVVRHFERDRSGRQLLDDLAELSRRHLDGPLGRNGRRNRDARADFEVRRGHAHGLGVALEKHIGQNRKRLAWLHDVLHHLQASEKRVTVDYDFHAGLHEY